MQIYRTASRRPYSLPVLLVRSIGYTTGHGASRCKCLTISAADRSENAVCFTR